MKSAYPREKDARGGMSKGDRQRPGPGVAGGLGEELLPEDELPAYPKPPEPPLTLPACELASDDSDDDTWPIVGSGAHLVSKDAALTGDGDLDRKKRIIRIFFVLSRAQTRV